jgi:hypothetical protein
MDSLGKPSPTKVATRWLIAGLRVPKKGDHILYGKYRNKLGIVVGMGYDEHRMPTIQVAPPDKPESKGKTIKLFPFRWAP